MMDDPIEHDPTELTQERLDILGIEDAYVNKDFGRERGLHPQVSEARQREIDRLNQKLTAKANKKAKEDEEEVTNFELKASPRVILFDAPLLKRSYNSIVQHNSKRHGFLLNDVLLITSPAINNPSKINLHQVLPLSNIAIADSQMMNGSEDASTFEIRTSERIYHLVAESESDKRIWLEELENAIFAIEVNNVNRNLCWYHEKNFSTLFSAAYHGDLDLLQRFYDRGYSLDLVDNNGMTALHYATINNHLDCARFLVDNGAQIDHLNSGLNSALLLAAAFAHHDIVMFLIHHGADHTVRNLKDLDCLMMAVVFDRYQVYLQELLFVLVMRGVDVNKLNVSRAAPIHECALRNSFYAIHILVAAGADINMKHGRSGLTALQLACSSAKLDVETVRAILDKGAHVNWKDANNNTVLDMVLSNHSQGATTTSLSAEVSSFALNTLPVLLEIVRKGGRYDEKAVAHLRDSFKEAMQSAVDHWRAMVEPTNFQDFVATREGNVLSDPKTWTADSASQCCLLCVEKFTYSNRRHHCRVCGILCCDPCSTKRMKFNAPGSSKTKPAVDERVCDSCFNRLSFECIDWIAAKNQAAKAQRKLEQKVQEEFEKRNGQLNSRSNSPLPSNTSTSNKNNKAANATSNIDSTQATMQDTQLALKQRGDKLEVLADKSENLKTTASDFKKMTKALLEQQQMKAGKSSGI